MAEEVESAILKTLNESGIIADSGEYVKQVDVEDHNALVGVLKSLEAHEMITLEVRDYHPCCKCIEGLCSKYEEQRKWHNS